VSVEGPRWSRHGWIVVALAVGAAWPASAVTGKARELVVQADQLQAAPDASNESARRAIALYQEAARLEPNSTVIQLKLADTALTIAAWTSGDRLPWYQLGKSAAERAVALDPNDAEALFLLAAHRGQIASLQRDLGGLLVPQELERLLSRALASNPRHARALHMMGMLLYRAPGPLRLLLKGSASDAETYLVAAIEADPNFSEARLDLARYYASRQQTARARAQIQAVLRMTSPTRPRAWREKHRPAAEELLRELPAE
jgi:cytochrome c-type biogenesis protein CcmH/NrfG